MPVINQPVRRRRSGRESLTAMSAVLLTVLAPLLGGAIAGEAAPGCQVVDENLAGTLRDQWVGAIQSQHPDRITRLFATDAALQGFARYAR